MNDIEFKKKISMKKQKAQEKAKSCIWGENLNGEDTCEGKIIKAHSIQRGKILKNISYNGMIKSLEVVVENGIPNVVFNEVGIKKFSTFTGFCQKHDKKIFEPIEDHFFENTIMQKYIYAYRAVSKEYNAKKVSIHLTDEEISDNDDKKIKFILKRKMLTDVMSLLELEGSCKYMQNRLYSNKLTGLKHHYYCFDREYPIACSSTFIPYHSFSGKPLFTKEEKDSIIFKAGENPNEIYSLFVNVFPENGKTHILISYFNKHKKRYKFLSKLERLSLEKQKIQISNMLINYIENLAFSPLYIEEKFSSKEIQKIKDTFIASVINPDNFESMDINLFR